MERKTKKADEAPVSIKALKPTWKKISRGTLYPFPNQRSVRVTKDDKLQATEDEIQKYRDHFELVKDGTGPFKVKEKETPVTKPVKKVVKEEYTLVPIGDGLYNVHSPGDKVMNDEGLPLQEAEALKKSLEEETVEQ